MEKLWYQRIGEPLAASRAEAEVLITKELQRVVPKTWAVEHDDETSSWRIRRLSIPPGEWSIQEYGVRVTKSLECIVFTHGNTDAGTLSLEHALMQALVIDAAALRHYGMEACWEHLRTHCRPNEWGYT